MPTRHGGSLAKNANTSLRLSFRATTTLPSASTPWTWNTFFARSSPMVVIVVMDGPLLVIRHQRSLYGMPCEAPSTSSGTVLQQRSDLGRLYLHIAVAFAALPKMPALCHFLT